MKRALPEFIIDQHFKRKEYRKDEKDFLLRYMKESGELYSAGGFVFDEISGKPTRIEDAGYRDDEYEWATNEIYHIDKYDAAVTDDFFNHVLNMKNANRLEV